jgi:hypothetical protein
MKKISLLTPLVLATLRWNALGAELDFNRDIRPILSEHCFTCHGPDANKRKGKLRLDSRESAFTAAESGECAVVPGDLEKSELIRRILTTDKDDIMPPSKEHKALKPAQVEMLKRWVKEGAQWTGHWAFQTIRSPEAPKPAFPQAIVRNPIDHFVQARLAEKGLKPAPEEDRARLLRRVSLDLTGLPPSPKDAEAFLKDPSTDAYEKAVDRLLASPHFGERLAIPWLDLARYGDTSGYHNDSLRDMWLWRDWVINAFNANQPFNEFTIEQIAGDLLPNATMPQQVASGFHRNVMTSDEGGIIAEEYLNIYVVDRVNTTGVTWLGMTMGCAQCHDHKYDPVTLKDYYQFYSFFHNVPETGKDGVRDRNPKPFLRVPSPEQKTEFDRLEAQVAEANKALAAVDASAGARQKEWEPGAFERLKAIEAGAAFAAFPLEGALEGRDEKGQPLALTIEGEAEYVEGPRGKALALAKKPKLQAGDVFRFEAAMSVAAWIRTDGKQGPVLSKQDKTQRGWALELSAGKPRVSLVGDKPTESIRVMANDALPADKFSHVAFTYDGSGKAAGVKIYVNGALAKAKVETDTLKGSFLGAGPFQIAGVGAIQDVRVAPGAWTASDLGWMAVPEARAILAKAPEQRSENEKKTLSKFFRDSQMPELLEARTRQAEATKARDNYERTIPNTMVMSEMEKPRDTFTKVRGAYDQNGDKVTAGVPAFLPQVPPRADGKPLNRLDLARWLVSPEHPLTARVAVNRWWATVFGTGLVKTLNDFGSQGEWPSHPQLLDWLAADFMRDWDIKRAIKQMVTSATYRQSSRVAPELLAQDSENRFLARGPRHRLDAELIRDNALAVGGILSTKQGGKGIKPPQPPGIWEINDMSGDKYVRTEGADQYRRGLYVYWRRSTVYPSFITFDAPTREFCVAQRAATSTPLQSLVLMNDPVYVEAARALAQRVLAEAGPDAAARLEYAWKVALVRAPSAEEKAILQKNLDQHLATYRQDKEAAKKLLQIGDLPRPAGGDESELAAWTAVANLILNLNETISN